MNSTAPTDARPLYLEAVDFPLIPPQNAPRAAASMKPADSSHPDLLPPGISVVVPVYNSQATLTDLLTRLAPVLAGLDKFTADSLRTAGDVARSL